MTECFRSTSIYFYTRSTTLLVLKMSQWKNEKMRHDSTQSYSSVAVYNEKAKHNATILDADDGDDLPPPYEAHITRELNNVYAQSSSRLNQETSLQSPSSNAHTLPCVIPRKLSIRSFLTKQSTNPLPRNEKSLWRSLRQPIRPSLSSLSGSSRDLSSRFPSLHRRPKRSLHLAPGPQGPKCGRCYNGHVLRHTRAVGGHGIASQRSDIIRSYLVFAHQSIHQSLQHGLVPQDGLARNCSVDERHDGQSRPRRAMAASTIIRNGR